MPGPGARRARPSILRAPPCGRRRPAGGGLMRQSRWNRPAVALAGVGLAVAMVAVPGSPATAAGQVAGPVLKLAAAQHSITLDSFGGQVYLDPGIWVEVLKSPLQFDVRRMSYTRPFTITQIIHAPDGGAVRRLLPAGVVQWNGG